MATTSGQGPNASQPNQPSDTEFCASVLALIPAYALGATDPEDEHFVQTWLPHCPEAAAALTEYTQIVEKMNFSIVPVTAPPQLAERLHASLQSQSPPTTRHKATGSARQTGKAFNLSWGWASSPWGFAAAALALLVLLLSNVYWGNRYNALEVQHIALQLQLQEQATLVNSLRWGHFQRLEMAAAAGGSPTSHAVMMYEPAATQAVLYVEGFSSLADDQVYQIWLIQGETRVNGGLFNVDDDGFGILVIDAPEPLSTYERMGITLEPYGGSSGPTTPPVVTGSFW